MAARELWRRTFPGERALVVGATGGVVLVHLGDHDQAGVDAATGDLRWRIDGRRHHAIRANVGNGLYVCPSVVTLRRPHGVAAIEVDTGRTRCAVEPTTTDVRTVGIGDRALAWGSYREFGCVDDTTGDSIWSGAHPEVHGWTPNETEFLDVVDGVLVATVEYVDGEILDRAPYPNAMRTTTAVDVATGRLLWTRPLRLVARAVFVERGGVGMVDLRDGRVLWRAEATVYAFEVCRAAGKLIVRDPDHVIGLDEEDGGVAWTRPAPSTARWELVDAGPAHVIVAVPGGDARVMDASTGEETFHAPLPPNARVCGDGERLFVSHGSEIIGWRV